MKEHGLIFSTELIPPLLDGRKTMTRRIIKPQPVVCFGCQTCEFKKDHFLKPIPIKYQKGDLIWVKETWCYGEYFKEEGEIWYKANGDDFKCFEEKNIYGKEIKWESPRFMFKKYARIWLEIIEDERIERLQDISIDDIIKEGLRPRPDKKYKLTSDLLLWKFEELWDSLNKKRGYGWDTNLWVRAIEFKRIER